jgi:hypothetical protein
LTKGDLNNDGFDDLIIGSPYDSLGRGIVTVFFSKRYSTGINLKNRADSDLKLEGKYQTNYR